MLTLPARVLRTCVRWTELIALACHLGRHMARDIGIEITETRRDLPALRFF